MLNVKLDIVTIKNLEKSVSLRYENYVLLPKLLS